MKPRALASLVLGVLACGEPIDDADEDDVVDRIDLAAPLAFELAPDARLVLEDASVEGVGHGTLVIDALAVDASAGAIFEVPLAEGTTALRLAGPNGSRRAAARESEVAADAHVVGARIEGLELGGFEDAWLVDAHGERIALDEPLVVDANSLAWTHGELVVIELEDDAAAGASGGSGVGGSGAQAHRRGLAGTPDDAEELARLLDRNGNEDPWVGDLRGDTTPELLQPGDSCAATAQCPVETRCVEDPIMSDGQFRCLALCTEPELADAPTPPTPSPSATCVDDSGCCDPSLVCSNGACVEAEDAEDDGGEDVGTGCDRDKDGWVNGCDRKPDESCMADSDGDGCNDSFDDNDEDNCECTTPIRLPRPNSTGMALLMLIWMRGRKRR